MQRISSWLLTVMRAAFVLRNVDDCQCLISFTEYTTHPDVQVILHVDSDDESRTSLPIMTDL